MTTISLDSTVATFARYGIRKASMEELARASGVSRQALYNRFGSKSALADWTVKSVIDDGLARALDQLADSQQSLVARMLAALDAWVGRHIDMLRTSPHAIEILAVAAPVPGEGVRTAERMLVAALTHVIRLSGPGSAAPRAGSIAQSLVWIAKGMIHAVPNHATFRRELDQIIGAILGR